MKTFSTFVLGCQQNEHDGVRISYLLKTLGFSEAVDTRADLVIVVACSVRQTAVDRIFGIVRNHPKSKIVVTGCVLDSDKKKLAKKDVVFWNIEEPEKISGIIGLSGNKEVNRILKKGGQLSNAVPIMYGCNNFCTYCATAITRGRERSRKMSAIINDVKKLIKNDNKDILLLGQTINSYRDPETGARLDDLFIHLNNLEGEFIISFLSNHPKDMSDEIINAVAKLPKIKKEIHLPVQSGSDKILRAMNRPYTVKQYLTIIDKIRHAAVKHQTKIAITTDVIVGFPGETESDFLKTVDLFKKVKFDLAYVNKYSMRPQTAACKLGDPIEWKEKQRRWRILDDIVNKKD